MPSLLCLPSLVTAHTHAQTHACTQESIRKLRSKIAQLFKSCEHLLKFANGPAQREAYVTLADGLFVFSKHLCETSPALSSLVYDPDPHLQECLQVLVYNPAPFFHALFYTRVLSLHNSLNADNCVNLLSYQICPLS